MPASCPFSKIDCPVESLKKAASKFRFQLAAGIGTVAAKLSKLAGKGTGASIKGKIITTLAPNSFSKVLSDRYIVAVSGTNGKTTTTHLLAAAIETLVSTKDVVTNADGANLQQGIVSGISENLKAKKAVLEVDERVVPELIRVGHPEVMVMLNFSRDQMDRNYDLGSLAKSWRTAINKTEDLAPVVVANACDPLIVWVAQVASQVIWVDSGASWTRDSVLCPACSAMLAADPAGSWSCTECDLKQPEAQYVVDLDDSTLKSLDGNIYRIDLDLPGRFNISNAGLAFAAAIEVGCEPEKILEAFKTISAPAGRFSTIDFGSCQARLLLAKNPAGWTESLQLAKTDPLIMPIDALAADGRDLSWLWEVDFEQLKGRKVICTGARAQDLAVRLTYAEVEYEVIPDLRKALDSVSGQIDVVTTYSPFQEMLSMGGLR